MSRYMDDDTYEALNNLRKVNPNAFYSIDDYTYRDFHNEDCRRKGMHLEHRNNYHHPGRMSDDEWDEWTY